MYEISCPQPRLICSATEIDYIKQNEETDYQSKKAEYSSKNILVQKYLENKYTKSSGCTHSCAQHTVQECTNASPNQKSLIQNRNNSEKQIKGT